VYVCLQRALREVGLTSVEQLKASITKLSCSVQKLHDSISSRHDDSIIIQPHSLVSRFFCRMCGLRATGIRRRPSPFPGQRSPEMTKSGSSFLVFILCYCIVVFLMNGCFYYARFSYISASPEIGWEEHLQND